MTGFKEFWEAYPRKVNQEKARENWKQVAPSDELIATIMKALQEHCDSEQWIKEDGQFIPHPSTWLNQRRWEDRLTAPQPKPKYKLNY